MAETHTVQPDVVETLMSFNAAVNNARLYPPTSELLQKSLTRLQSAFDRLFRKKTGISFSVSDSRLLIDDQMLPEEAHEKDHVRLFLETMIDFNLQRMAFRKGLTAEENHAFLALLGTSPDEIRDQGGLTNLIQDKALKHVRTQQSTNRLHKDDVRKKHGRSPSHVKAVGEADQGPPTISTAEKTSAQATSDPIKAGLSKLLKGDIAALRDPDLVRRLPKALAQLLKNEREDLVEILLEQLNTALLNKDPAMTSRLLNIWPELHDRISAGFKLDAMLKMSESFIQWMKTEPQSHPIFEQLFPRYRYLSQALIQQNRFSDCIHLLETFHLIAHGKLIQGLAVQEMARESLVDIADRETVMHLVREMKAVSEERPKKQITYIFAMLGNASIDLLLNILEESQDAYERGNILRVMSKIGHLAPDLIEDQLREAGPWYYVRNLILILGRVGNEKHLSLIKSFLGHKDSRVREEALKSIYTIGGIRAGEILLSLLPSAEEALKLKIIAMVGELRMDEAVTTLMSIFNAKSTAKSESRTDIEAAVCAALGSIATEAAVSALREIATPKHSLLHRSTHSSQTKMAAQQALNKIENECDDDALCAEEGLEE